MVGLLRGITTLGDYIKRVSTTKTFKWRFWAVLLLMLTKHIEFLAALDLMTFGSCEKRV